MPKVYRRAKARQPVRKWSGRTRFTSSKKTAKMNVQSGRIGSTKPKALYPFIGIRNLLNQYAPMSSLAPVPQRKAFSLRYAEGGPTLTGLAVGTAGVGGTEIVWALNGLFDPNISGTGHQPFYFDQLVNCGYQRYKVESVSIKVRAMSPNASDTGLQVQIDAWTGAFGTLAGVSWNTANERPQNWYLTPQLTAGEQTLVLERIPIHAIQGMTKMELDANTSDFTALVTANPARSPYLRIAAINTSGSNSGTVDATVELTFHGYFFDRQLVAAS